MSPTSVALMPLAPLHRVSSLGGARRSFPCPKNLWRSRVSMSIYAKSRSTFANDAHALFLDYKPTNTFLFPGQGAQTVGMGVEAQKVKAAADLYVKASEILGFDLLDVCANGPKEKLDSTVISQIRPTPDSHNLHRCAEEVLSIRS